MSGKITIIEGSGNVFADLGLPNAEERKTKADLAYQIGTIITDRGLTQVQAGDLLGIEQPHVSNLVRGRLSGFSVERLMEFLTALGRDVEIIVRPKAEERTRGAIIVIAQPSGAVAIK
ncbi:MAG: helix-turn-helix domain-containing protein [Thermomicrobiales bacterium]